MQFKKVFFSSSPKKPALVFLLVINKKILLKITRCIIRLMITYVFKMYCLIHKVLIGGRKLCKMFIFNATARSAGNGEFAGFH